MSTAVEPTSQIHTTGSQVPDITSASASLPDFIQEQGSPKQDRSMDNDNRLSSNQIVPEHNTKKTTVSATIIIPIVPHADLEAELIFCKDRLEAIEKEERTGVDPEKIALEELEKSTRSLISIREKWNAKQEELDKIDAKAELDIKKLQEQIASLQKQLDAVSLKRKEMAANAAEQHKRLVEQNGGGIDDD
ncbi:hypothetical protein FBU30_010587 [Linnemannia zychae]|nr:hypothetical protein FBU30_010587 [Linnemannia zychae]